MRWHSLPRISSACSRTQSAAGSPKRSPRRSASGRSSSGCSAAVVLRRSAARPVAELHPPPHQHHRVLAGWDGLLRRDHRRLLTLAICAWRYGYNPWIALDGGVHLRRGRSADRTHRQRHQRRHPGCAEQPSLGDRVLESARNPADRVQPLHTEPSASPISPRRCTRRSEPSVSGSSSGCCFGGTCVRGSSPSSTSRCMRSAS